MASFNVGNMNVSPSGWRDHTGKVALGGAALALGLTVTWIGEIPSGEDAVETWLFLLLAFVGGVVLLVYGFREYRRRSLVTNTPTSKVRSLAIGTVELEGSAKSVDEKSVLKAPFSGEGCVLYEYKIEEYEHDDDGSNWETIETGREYQEFYLNDGTGKVLVNPDGADVRLPEDGQYRADSMGELPEPAQDFLKSRASVGVQSGGWFSQDRRYTERYIAPDDHVYVFGKALPKGDSVGGRGSATNPENAVINEDRTTPMFLISDRPEDEVLSSMKWRMIGSVLGGFVVGVGGFAGLVWYLGLL